MAFPSFFNSLIRTRSRLKKRNPVAAAMQVLGGHLPFYLSEAAGVLGHSPKDVIMVQQAIGFLNTRRL
jgi:hypothetical protein